MLLFCFLFCFIFNYGWNYKVLGHLLFRNSFLLRQHMVKWKFCKYSSSQDSYLAIYPLSPKLRGGSDIPAIKPADTLAENRALHVSAAQLFWVCLLTSSVALSGLLSLLGSCCLMGKAVRWGRIWKNCQTPPGPSVLIQLYELITRVPKLKQIQCCIQFGMHWCAVTRFSISVEREKKKTVYWQPGWVKRPSYFW